ncbi:MAG TPA: VIT1/CCC1 transporter family protein [Vicinamibacterales bacterium]
MEPRREAILDPLARISEVLFGLIMALTFTTTIDAAGGGRGEIRTLTFGAIGCNIAWGLVDAVMYLVNLLVERGRAFLSAAPGTVPRAQLGLDDWRGAFAVFLLVCLSTFPIVIPFLFIRNAALALRTSNLVAIAMLFGCGYALGRYGGFNALKTGLAMVLLGVVLVAITIVLGG